LYELDIDEGNYQLKAWLAGHGKAGPKTVNVVEGEPAEVDWEFGAGYTLTGTVLKASTFNAPVAWANVGVHKLNHWPPESGRDGYQPITNELLAGSLQTDGFGKFKLAGLEAGDYLVKASSASAAPATKQIALHADADVTLELADGGHLRIRTLDAKGWPVQNAGCLVQKMPLMDQTYYLDSNKNGECQILRMEPGQYLVKGQFRAPPNLEVVEQTATVSAGGWTVVEIVSKNEAPLLADGADASGRSFRAQEGSQTDLPEVTAPPQDRTPPGLVAAASNPNPAVIINVTLQPRDKPLPPPPPDPHAIVSGTREPPRTGR